MRAMLVMILALVFSFPGSASADEVRFKVRVLLATKKGSRVDPQIPRNVRKYLSKSFGSRYSSFKLLSDRAVKVVRDAEGDVPLPDGSTLKLKYVGMQGEFIKIKMRIKELKTTIRIRDGGLFFQAGHRYKNGMLVLAISAAHSGKKGKEVLSSPRPEPRKAHPATRRKNKNR